MQSDMVPLTKYSELQVPKSQDTSNLKTGDILLMRKRKTNSTTWDHAVIVCHYPALMPKRAGSKKPLYALEYSRQFTDGLPDTFMGTLDSSTTIRLVNLYDFIDNLAMTTKPPELFVSSLLTENMPLDSEEQEQAMGKKLLKMITDIRNNKAISTDTELILNFLFLLGALDEEATKTSVLQGVSLLDEVMTNKFSREGYEFVQPVQLFVQ